MKHQILNLPETARKWSRAVAPVSAHRSSAATGRLRRSDEQQELWGNFVDKHVQENFGGEAAPAARRDESGPITLFRSTAASRREPTGEMGAAALDRAASEARAAAADRPTWQLEKAGTVNPRVSFFEKNLARTGSDWHTHGKNH